MPSLPPGAFYFSCGDFLFCRFSSNFRDLDYVGENAHDLFTVRYGSAMILYWYDMYRTGIGTYVPVPYGIHQLRGLYSGSPHAPKSLS